MRVRVRQVGRPSTQQPYRVVVADPPWQTSDRLGKRGASGHYKVMSLDALKKYELPPLADDCVLFLWRLAIMDEEARDLARAWGFNPTKGEIVWRKITANGKEHFGMGRIVRGAHEVCLIGTRGKPHALRHDIRSIFAAPVPRSNGKVKHSAKPDAFFSIVRMLFDGPRVSLFERTQRYGFTCVGDQMEP